MSVGWEVDLCESCCWDNCCCWYSRPWPEVEPMGGDVLSVDPLEIPRLNLYHKLVKCQALPYHLRIATTCLQRPLFCGSVFQVYSIQASVNNDHLSTVATILGQSLYKRFDFTCSACLFNNCCISVDWCLWDTKPPCDWHHSAYLNCVE